MEANTIYKKKICKVCNKEFLITDKNRRFTTCSYECQVYRPSNRVRSWIRKHDPEYFNYIKEAK